MEIHQQSIHGTKIEKLWQKKRELDSNVLRISKVVKTRNQTAKFERYHSLE